MHYTEKKCMMMLDPLKDGVVTTGAHYRYHEDGSITIYAEEDEHGDQVTLNNGQLKSLFGHLYMDLTDAGENVWL